ncbi:MAG: hypothetical protein HN489_11910 [Opitutae bacterium]|nr:hypothetical protein [Opitutae bacterium]
MVFLFLFFSCGESELREKAIQLFDENASILSLQEQNNSSVTRSSDGLQFTKREDQKKISQTVGLTPKGKVSFEGDLKDGKPHGNWTTFFPDGRPRWKGVKKEGVSHGPFTMWYSNGKRKIEGNYEEGKKHGLSTMWHLNGVKWKEQSHDNGNPSGTWRTWDSRGELVESIDHRSTVEK